MKKILLLSALCLSMGATAQKTSTVTIHETQGKNVIPKEIYGQFAEHLGTCIYGGLWVGPESSIPNTNGYRNDVLGALKDLHVPVLRWPGGCFADTYHWRDGIGPRANRPTMMNSNWGDTKEDNSFGTHEFLNLCEMLDCEPYVSMNVGSGTVQETAEWVEYMTAENGPMAELRKKNGRQNPWKVKYIGVGNESWGCGGNMRPEYYSDLYRRYATYCHNWSGNRLYKVGSGASDYDYNWTEVLMKNVGTQMNGLSLHYYTCIGWSGSKGAATKFDADNYYWALGKCLGVEEVLKKHIEIMDKYDPQKRVDLLVDEWGTWWDEEPGTHPGHLFQQNTLRDAFVASLSLDVFHRYTDRVKMTNIAQIVNVLQSMILTKDDKMVLTPTYHVFKMYNVHMDATYLPTEVSAEERSVMNERGGERTFKMLDATASRAKDGTLNVSLSNVDLDNSNTVTVTFDKPLGKKATAQIITSKRIDDFNSFEKPDVVKINDFKDFKIKDNTLTVKMPAKSIITISVK